MILVFWEKRRERGILFLFVFVFLLDLVFGGVFLVFVLLFNLG